MEINSTTYPSILKTKTLFDFKLSDISHNIIRIIITDKFKFKEGSNTYKLCYNYLFLNSNIVFGIYCCYEFCKHNKVDLIDLPFIDKSFTCLFVDVKIISSSKIYSFFSESNTKLILKTLLHKFYRIFFLLNKNKIKNENIVKYWCDVDEKLHLSVIKTKNTIIFIFPFVNNLKRAFLSIKKIYSSSNKKTLIGLPYSFKTLFRIVFSKNLYRDLAIIDHEYKAYNLHANDYDSATNIYTSDEFLTGIFITNNILINNKKSIINKAHGIGFYSPFISYTEFECFNEGQKLFYNTINTKINYKTRFSSVKLLDTQIKSNIVIIHQNFEDYKHRNLENLIQLSVFKILNFSILNKKIYIKFHPNIKNKTKKNFLETFENFTEISDLNSLSEISFIGISSTAYYDFRDYGNFFFISNNKDIIFKIFGNVNCLSEDELKMKILE